MTTAMQVQYEDTTTSPQGDLYLTHRAAIEAAVRAVCRRHRMRFEDAEDFAGQVQIHLIQNDCAVLRRFQGRSSLSTYLLTVVTHLGQDWRNARWGKFRPSVEARRQGPIAVHLERLIRRDGLTFDEACETLRLNFRVTESRTTLEGIASTLPKPCRRRLVGDELLENRPSNGPSPDAVAETRAASTRGSIARMHLARAIAALPPADALVLKLRFEDGMPVVDIARALGMPAKPLYRRVERLLRRIRVSLEAQGICATVVRFVLTRDGLAGVADDTDGERATYRLFPASLPPPERP